MTIPSRMRRDCEFMCGETSEWVYSWWDECVSSLMVSTIIVSRVCDGVICPLIRRSPSRRYRWCKVNCFSHFSSSHSHFSHSHTSHSLLALVIASSDSTWVDDTVSELTHSSRHECTHTPVSIFLLPLLSLPSSIHVANEVEIILAMTQLMTCKI